MFLDTDVNIIGNESGKQFIDRYSLIKSTVFTWLSHFRTGVEMCEHNGRPTCIDQTSMLAAHTIIQKG